ISTGLAAAGHDFVNGVQGLPAGFGAAFQDLLAGDATGAYNALSQVFVNGFLPGFNVVQLPSGILNVVPMGPLGDLAPVLAIPGQMAQNFANMLPAGTIPGQMAQNATNLVSALTNFGTTLDLNGQVPILNFGVPLQLVLDAIGGPANLLGALNS